MPDCDANTVTIVGVKAALLEGDKDAEMDGDTDAEADAEEESESARTVSANIHKVNTVQGRAPRRQRARSYAMTGVQLY